MKIIYFLKNGSITQSDKDKREHFRAEGYRVIMSNGSLIKGFEDSCDAIYCSSDFPHITEWAEAKGITVLADAVEPEPEPKPRRTRKAKPDPSPE